MRRNTLDFATAYREMQSVRSNWTYAKAIPTLDISAETCNLDKPSLTWRIILSSEMFQEFLSTKCRAKTAPYQLRVSSFNALWLIGRLVF